MGTITGTAFLKKVESVMEVLNSRYVENPRHTLLDWVYERSAADVKNFS